MDRTAAAEELLKIMLASIVDGEEPVTIRSSMDEKGVLLEVNVPPEDMPRLIGKDGRTINAVREYFRALGKKHNANYSIKVIEHA